MERQVEQEVSAYDTVEWKIGWTGASWLSFGFVMLFFFGIGYLYRWRPDFFFWLRAVLLVFPTVSAFGVFAAWRATRGRKGGPTARLAGLANATVLASCILALLWTIVR